MRRFFWVPKTNVRIDGSKNIRNFTQTVFFICPFTHLYICINTDVVKALKTLWIHFQGFSMKCHLNGHKICYNFLEHRKKKYNI